MRSPLPLESAPPIADRALLAVATLVAIALLAWSAILVSAVDADSADGVSAETRASGDAPD